MRITDDRYTRDRLRLDLALRLIGHEARTRTIRSWTGLTDDRIRKLYRSYVADAGRRDVRRHRGKSPRQSAYFMRNAAIRREAAGLATLLCILGLLRREAGAFAGRRRAAALGRKLLRGLRDLCVAVRASADLVRARLPPAPLARETERDHAWTTARAAAVFSSSCAMRNAPKACEFCAASRPPARPGLSVGDC